MKTMNASLENFANDNFLVSDPSDQIAVLCTRRRNAVVQICELFETVFKENQFSVKRILRTTLASALCVMSGCANFGGSYEQGNGVAADAVSPNEQYQHACEDGDMAACTNLGNSFAKGVGVDEDQKRANKLYKQACDGGNMSGCSSLGDSYEQGRGVAADQVRANELYKQACVGDNIKGCANLEQGVDGAEDEARAWVLTSNRPYLIRALNKWIVDNNLTPHILVDTAHELVEVPNEFVENGRIILNVSPEATRSLVLGDDVITFNARFSGNAMDVLVPVSSVLSIYARENGQGMKFGKQKDQAPLDLEPDKSADKPAT